MNFDFSDGEKALQQTARDYLKARAPLQLCRGVLESGSGSAPDLWKGAAEMGWLGTAIPEDLGGAHHWREKLVQRLVSRQAA